MRPWRVAPSLINLRAQVNALYPNRSKDSDGTIGDAAHLARVSDHAPNERGVVCALDLTHDPAGGCDVWKIAEALRASKNPRIKYVIFNRRIFSSAVNPWEWRPYEGPSPHTEHVHISVMDSASDDYPWSVVAPRKLKGRKR